jgi:pimeloyl-ACP methyl ester carboxylesterase
MIPGKLSVLLKMASPRRYKDPEYMNRIAGDIYGGALRRSPELVSEHLRHVRWSSDYGYYRQLIAGFGWSSLPWLRLLPQPTLVMSGADDPRVPAVNARILARLIPDARLVTVDDGHLFLVTSARESARLVSGFLT